MERTRERTVKHADERRPHRFAIVLSALVFPGAGQIVQRRWLAGMAFAVVFTAAFLVCMFSFFRIILAFYRMGFDFGPYEPGHLPVRTAGISFVIAILIYAVNVVDAYVAYRRASSARARKNLADRNPDLL